MQLTDHFFLWPDSIPGPVRCVLPITGEETHHCRMASWPVQLLRRRAASWSRYQRILSGSVRLPAHHDVVHALDGRVHLHTRVCSITTRPGVWRGHVWHSMGGFSGQN